MLFIAGPTVLNSLLDGLRDLECSVDTRHLQTVIENVIVFPVLVCLAH